MKIETQCIRAGYEPKFGEPHVLPIAQSTTYRYESAEQMADLFDLKTPGYIYSRIANPTVEAVEKKIAALEGGIAALCTSSGQAAIMIAIMNIAGAGDNFVCAAEIYGGSINLFSKTLKQFGIEVRFVSYNMTDEEIAAKFDDRTKAVFGETLANPSLNIFDIERFAKIAHTNKVPLIVDNTLATPILCRPIEHGADIIVHSTTKYMDGHAAVVGGVIVDSGKFDWAASGRFPTLTTPDDSYHGMVFTEAFGPAAYYAKARVHLMRDMGACTSAQDAFLLNLGLETLHLRMERHCSNALALAEHLVKHDKVAWVNYPGLAGSKNAPLVEKYMSGQASGIVTFGVKGGYEAAKAFMNKLQLITRSVHVADLRTMILHPASTTHRQVDETGQKAAGITPDMVRISVGLENIADIIADIKSAL